MKKVFSILLLCVLLATSVLTFCACTDSSTEELVVYNWEEYIYSEEDMKADFAAYYKDVTGKDIKVTYVTFDTNETMLTRITNGGSRADVICPSEYAIQRLIEGDYLEKINYFTDTTFVNDANIDSDIIAKVQSSFADEDYDLTEYMVPYMIGTLGVLYNTDVVSSEDAEAAGWSLLWNKSGSSVLSEELTGKIFMKDSVRDSYAATLFYLKEQGLLGTEYTLLSADAFINSIDSTLLGKAEEVLVAQKSELKGYAVDFDKDDLITGRAYAGLAWSGDAMYAIEESEGNLDYFVPSSGGNIWFDGWVIPKTAVNKTAAKLFIDWLNTPTVAMLNMMEIGYTSAVDKAVLLADDEAMDTYYDVYEWADDEHQEAQEYFFDDARRYFDVNDLTLGVMHDFGAQNVEITEMWGRVRAAGVSAWEWLIYVAIAVAVVAAVVVVVVILRNKKSGRVKID